MKRRVGQQVLVWVYSDVEIPDDTPEDEIEDAVMDALPALRDVVYCSSLNGSQWSCRQGGRVEGLDSNDNTTGEIDVLPASGVAP